MSNESILVPTHHLILMQLYAKRYADGRSSHAVSSVNDFTRWMVKRGIEINKGGDPSIYARDGMGEQYDGLTPDQAGNRAVRAGTFAEGCVGCKHNKASEGVDCGVASQCARVFRDFFEEKRLAF
ncbi:MAG: hypothetical protein HQL74_07420 [Magnetococcales bacterium]|nr:hypothetical protein [Magnetococcales bacterium]